MPATHRRPNLHLSSLSSTCRLVLLTGGLGLLVASVAAQPDRLLRRFETANEAYAQGRYEQAVEGYRDILGAGYASVALYHNLGNAYVRLGRTGPAVWAYEKGRRLRPNDPRLRHNLEHVRQQAGLPQTGLPPRGFAALVTGWSSLLLFGTGVLLLSAGLLGAVFWRAPDRTLAWRAPISWGPVAIGVLLVIVALGTSYVQAHDHPAVVMPESVPLRTAPAETATPDTTIGAGTMLEIQSDQENWARVRLRDHSEGWVRTRTLGEM